MGAAFFVALICLCLMLTSVRYLRPFHRVLEDVESQIERLLVRKIVVRQLMPHFDALQDGAFTSVFLAQYALQVRSHLVVQIVLRAQVIKIPLSAHRVMSMSTAYACKVSHGHLVTQYHSGHHDHKPVPHVTDDWSTLTGQRGPNIPGERGYSISQFILAVEEWRVANRSVLPVGLGSLKEVRWASLKERSSRGA